MSYKKIIVISCDTPYCPNKERIPEAQTVSTARKSLHSKGWSYHNHPYQPENGWNPPRHAESYDYCPKCTKSMTDENH